MRDLCGESDTGACFFRVLRFPLPILITPTAPHSSSSSTIRGWYNRSISGRHTKWTQSNPTPRNLKKLLLQRISSTELPELTFEFHFDLQFSYFCIVALECRLSLHSHFNYLQIPNDIRTWQIQVSRYKVAVWQMAAWFWVSVSMEFRLQSVDGRG
jgi:hypothetical protein